MFRKAPTVDENERKGGKKACTQFFICDARDLKAVTKREAGWGGGNRINY